MILYKYYGHESGNAALETRRLGFRVPLYFNDPFEASVILGESFTANRIQETLRSTAILSLTRNPLNSLMWAHYAAEHKGFVIGYEVKDKFFQCEESNIIPVQKGNVIYTKTKPVLRTSTKLTTMLCNFIDGIPYDDLKVLELVNHLFLNKDTIWSYEEEVRIVKRLHNLTMEQQEFWENSYNQYSSLTKNIAPSMSRELITGLKIYNHEPRIREVYIGTRNKISPKNLILLNALQEAGTKIYSVKVDKKSWNLVRKKITVIA